MLKRLADVPTLPVPYRIAAHVPEVEAVWQAWRELHRLPTEPVPDVRFYTCSSGAWYHPTSETAADAVTIQGLGAIDFARTVERAWEDGVRIFVEHGPRALCAGWIGRTLGSRDHLAMALDAPEGHGIRQLFHVVAELAAAGVPLNTAALHEHLAAASHESPPARRPLTLPAHPPEILFPAPPPSRTPPSGDDVLTASVMLPAPELADPVPEAPLPVFHELPVLPHAAVAVSPPPAPVSAPGSSANVPSPAAAVVAHSTRVAEAHRRFLAGQAQAHARYLATLQRASGWAVRAGTGERIPVAPAPPEAPGSGPAFLEPTAPLPSVEPAPPERRTGPRSPVGPTFTRTQLERLATGPVSELLGPRFAPLDDYRRITRMPAPPLLMADRVTGIDAEPGAMGTGTIWTETDIPADAWYLDPAGRIPPGLMIEAGQADLLLISWLGVDLLTRGERVYRLLGCELTFHGSPPGPGETLRYEIHIDGHGEHDGVRLFFFHYNAYPGDELRLTMREGQAGFFTEEQLSGTGGILWDARANPPDQAPPVDPPAVASGARSFTTEQVHAFANGRPADCFGPGWRLTRTHIRTPRIGDGCLRLLGSVQDFEPTGGPWGRGYLRGETPVSPDDWFFDGHFPNDPCMPGTLMFEGCLQAMAFYLTAAGFTLERDGWRFEPVTGVPYPLFCRGQVTPSSHLLTYEVFVSELSAGPEVTLVADVLCMVDGVRAFHARGVGLRLVPDWPLTRWRTLGPPAVQLTGTPVAHHTLAGLQGHQETGTVAEVDGFRYDYAAMLACAWGRPSEAFGPAYARFDSARRLARLPGPPFHFMSRVVGVEGPAWVMEAGAAVEVEYEVPQDVWYFEQNDSPDAMPFSVLMEVVLQASGWLASYVGSALTSEADMLFRNLDGAGTVHWEVRPGMGVLHTRARLREVSRSGEMIIQTFDVTCTCAGELVFDLTTMFGFFPPSAFDNQGGLPPAPQEPDFLTAPCTFEADLGARPERYCGGPLRLPGPMLLMLDRVTGYWLDAGLADLGRLRAEKDVNPGEWFFQAHFFQDSVQPGSLGVQAMCQLLQFYAIERGLGTGLVAPRFEPVLPHHPVTWKYRGQVTPRNHRITVEVEIREMTADAHGIRVIGDGWLWADGTRIYQVEGLGIGITPGSPPDPHHSGGRPRA
ncbi:hypothetical protein ACFWIB_36990 [Streptomyces sp. NPDC127051]|uniref:hypothetical protein n=1 Tax=Streptomyces sp. NPDC127051 TaxID=3347119 RepID=UPI00365A4BA9